MLWTFYITAAVAVFATGAAITRASAMHALLYLVVSLLAVALMMFLIGAPVVAAFEVIIYAGAIVVLFLFVVMMLGLTREEVERERRAIAPRTWVLPSVLTLVLLGELIYVSTLEGLGAAPFAEGDPREIGRALFGPYLLGVEMASMLLLAGLVGAFHVGRRGRRGAGRTRDG